MSIRAMNWAWEQARHQDLSDAAILILLRIADHADTEGVCWPGNARIAEYTNKSERTVERTKARLIELGLLSVVTRGKTGGGRGRDLLVLHLEGKPDIESVLGSNPTLVTDQTRHTGQTKPDTGDAALYRNRKKEPSEGTVSGAIAPDVRPEIETLCSFFESSLNQLLDTPGRERVSKSWATDLDRMVRLDGRTPEQIRNATLWAHRHEFWQRNILSPAKLRKHFDRLALDARAERKNNPQAAAQDVEAWRPPEEIQ